MLCKWEGTYVCDQYRHMLLHSVCVCVPRVLHMPSKLSTTLSQVFNKFYSETEPRYSVAQVSLELILLLGLVILLPMSPVQLGLQAYATRSSQT